MYRLAVIKTTSCSGCISELLYALTSSSTVFENYEVKYFTEIVDSDDLGADIDIVFVEGSISNLRQENLLRSIRDKAKFIVALGTCATFGGIQTLRVSENLDAVKRSIYPNPDYIDVYSDVKSVDNIIRVDLVFPGCPVNGDAVASFLKKYALGGLPITLFESVCGECKRRGIGCVMVSKGIPCLGPVTNSGCGAICPSFNRGCYGCFGIKSFDIDKEKLEYFVDALTRVGMGKRESLVLLRGFSYKVYEKFIEG